MKIICTDNFGRESIAESVVAEHMNQPYATFVCEALNKQFSGDTSSSFFKVVEDDYKPWGGMAELV